MAKSIRSRWKKKMRSVKRERYSPKELARLKKVLQLDKDVEMMDPQLVTVTDVKKIKEDIANKQDSMDVDEQGSSKYNPKTMKDEHGHYPEWMSKKQIKKLKNKKKNKKKLIW